MVRERIQELVDFVTTESPYRSATKGWVNDDVFLQWGAEEPNNQASAAGEELLGVSVFWKPINEIALLLLCVFAVASIFVFGVVSFSHGAFQLSSIGLDIGEKTVGPSVEVKQEVKVSNPTAELEKTVAPSVEVKQEVKVSNPTAELEKTVAPPVEAKQEVKASESVLKPSSRDLANQKMAKPVTAEDLFQSRRL